MWRVLAIYARPGLNKRTEWAVGAEIARRARNRPGLSKCCVSMVQGSTGRGGYGIWNSLVLECDECEVGQFWR